MKRRKILVIEDEADIREVIIYNLIRENYDTLGASDGEEGMRLIQAESPDLVLLDLMLPGVNGLDICKRLKMEPSLGSIAIIMVTAKGEEADIVLGLELGADDYVTKPFSPKELVSRVKAVLRRSRAERQDETGDRIVREGLVIDSSKHSVLVDGRPVELTATQFRILRFLALHPGRVYTRDQLVNQAIGQDSYVIDRNIDVHIRAVRKKLSKYMYLIETVRSVGYRFKDTGE